MKKALLALTLVAPAAYAADADQLRCLRIADNVARLACYDAAAIAIRDATPAVVVPETAANTTATAKPAATAAADNFGRPALAAAPVEQLESLIPGQFTGWVNGGSVRLANGQVWKFMQEGTTVRAITDPKVTISAGFMGSYFMKIEGLSIQIKVRRLQ